MATTGEESIHYGRKDFTQELGPEQRRLDSFARLLAARSECVATTIINGKLYIAANELHRKPTDTETLVYKSIKKVADFFGKVARQEKITSTEREEIFFEICSPSHLRVSVQPELVKEIVKGVLAGKDPTISELETMYGNKFEVASRLYGDFVKHYKDFSKLEKSLGLSDKKMTSEQIEAFKKGAEILQNQEKRTPPVHSEGQILDVVVDLINKSKLGKGEKIYFGISKLCCLNCRCLLESANKVFQENRIKVEVLTRGHHDIDFDWNAPEKFQHGYEISEKESTRQDEELIKEFKGQIEFEIGRETRKLVARVLKVKKSLPKRKGVMMEASSSDSDAESTLITKLKHQKALLSGNLNLLISLQKQDKDMTLPKAINLLAVAQRLYELESFVALYKQEESKGISEKEVKRDFINILQTLQQDKNPEIAKITPEELFLILKLPELVGKEAIEYFKKLDLSNIVSSTSSLSMEGIELSQPKEKSINKKEETEDLAARLQKAESAYSEQIPPTKEVKEEPQRKKRKAQQKETLPESSPSKKEPKKQEKTTKPPYTRKRKGKK